MASQPNMRFDVDALFAHLVNNLGHRLDNEKDWAFTFRSEDLATLTRVGESLSDEFDVQLQEEVETIEGDRHFMGPPLLAVNMRGALGVDEVKALASRFADLARTEGLTYEGVSCYDPIDEEELFGWLDLESAIWRLRHFTDTGLDDGAEMPWVFAVAASDPLVLNSAAASLRDQGYSNLDTKHDDAELLLWIRYPGRNNVHALEDHYRRIERIVVAAGAQLLGVQFFEDNANGESDH